MNVAIEIPDDIGRLLGDQTGDVSRAVLEPRLCTRGAFRAPAALG